MSDSLFDRGKALEDRFFSEKDQQLLEQLKQEIADKEKADALAAASGISDQEVLNALVEQNVTAESLTSVALIPLIAVAWSDGIMEENERSAILKAAAGSGINEGTAAYKLLNQWMDAKPGDDLLQSWKDYIGSLKTSLDTAALNQVKVSVIGRAKSVAEAAGGFLGIGSISSKETAVLNELENCFN